MTNILMKKKFIMRSTTGKSSEMVVERPVYEMDELNEICKFEEPHDSCKEKSKKLLKLIKPKPSLKKIVPLLDWLPGYIWKEWFAGDLVSGMTLAVLQLPQAMACAVLADIPPVNGIYTSIFPVLVYVIFGTSKHVSVGTFAAVSLMTGAVVTEHMSIRTEKNLTKTLIHPKHDFYSSQYTDVEVAQTISFTVALIELCMYVLRLGIVAQLLSETFLNAFTCAAAYHIVNSQIRDLLGIGTKKRIGNFAIPLTISDIAKAFSAANFLAMGISFAACTTLLLNNYVFKPWLSKRTSIPFPAELVVVGIVTTFSKTMDFEKNYNITIIGFIPTGFPKLSIPKFQLVPAILMDSFTITIVCYAVTISLGLIFAQKCMYEVGFNQELLALGLSNAFGSFSLCMPISASLSRSVLRYNAGGRTQLSAVVSSGILIMVILWIAPLFETLPRCILASIIVVALTELLLKVRFICKYWQLSSWDGTVWIITFLVTFIVQISYGLIAGIVVSLLVICIEGNQLHTCLLGIVPNTDLYLDVEKYKAAQEIDGIKIFHSTGGLNFAISKSYKKALIRETGLDPGVVFNRRIQLHKKGLPDDEVIIIKVVILDFSHVTFIDTAGVDFLRTLRDDYERINIEMEIAGCPGSVFEVIIRCNRIEKKERKFLIFPTVHDAVLFAQMNFISKNK
ncbi:unnamed protein product [Psylliodes chrysocephalus]|uniref:STAS domain-containing protein n=1 Tax=Psylliodes chrysocephalus TaxID=3402493 RepID=A0A9P0CYZ2_9CUCU|nr:unnamed protein product [Psylliodes chrysocephala]